MVKVFINVDENLNVASVDEDLELFENKNNAELEEQFEKITSDCNTIVMGKKTFDYINQANMWPYQKFETYVVSSEVFSTEDVKQIDIDMTPAMIEFTSDKGVCIFGGKRLINFLVDQDLVDEIVLNSYRGKIKSQNILFENKELDRKFELVSEEKIQNINILTYKRG